MKGKFKFIIFLAIIVLVVIAIQNQQKSKLSAPSYSSSPKVSDSNLNHEENFILNPPFANAPKIAKQAHAQVVSSLAKETKYLEIKDCKPNPLVLKVKEGTDIEIRNIDNVKVRIIVDSLHYYDIPANGTKTTTAKFKYGTGDYGYVCDEAGIVGFLHITK